VTAKRQLHKVVDFSISKCNQTTIATDWKSKHF